MGTGQGISVAPTSRVPVMGSAWQSIHVQVYAGQHVMSLVLILGIAAIVIGVTLG
ncbi:hypothetical protein [Pseudofrankia sp. DC12]|uniref:hypothetical protein n=1 Tax=Pseudofrankia sp. DC12 TaxID=683315 RepID=UPI000B250FF7|nr:hypothetical protein [Pseudofrankia sp. DC12]